MTQTDTIDWSAELEIHSSWLRKVLRSRIADSHCVDDVLQDVAVAVFKQMDPKLKESTTGGRKQSRLPTDREQVGPWLYRVAVRQAVNVLRKRNRKSEPKPVAEIEVQANDHEPLHWLVSQEMDANLQKAIQRLSGAQREILMLKFTENWSYREIAKHLGISQRAVEHRLFKARKQLRSNLLVADISGASDESK